MKDNLPDIEELKESGLHPHEIAFQVWALQADQSPKRTSEIMANEYGMHHSPAVISQWVNRHEWKFHLREFLTGIAPSQMDRAAASLVGGAGDAAATLVRIVRGEIEPNRDLINASTAILDRVGFLPHTRREAASTGVNQVSASAELSELSMSDEELEQALHGIGRIRSAIEHQR